MHPFTRGDAPVNFTKIKHRHIIWDDFINSPEHIAIGDYLYEHQGHYCAYCEVYLHDKQDGFIEHLEKRSDNPQRTFDWINLFFSCRYLDSCGTYKDNDAGEFKIADIIDPSCENPLDFFDYDTLGNLCPRKDLDECQKKRAEETIRVFNLNCSRLKSIRLKAVEAVSFFL